MTKAQLQGLIRHLPPDAFDLFLGAQGGGVDQLSFSTRAPIAKSSWGSVPENKIQHDHKRAGSRRFAVRL